MCGICGHISFDPGRHPERTIVDRMVNELAHRGPDDHGIFADDAVCLGHTRLSIIDLTFGHQPLANEDQTVWIAFNGEIYNHKELRREMESRHRFRTQTDTEVIVHLWEELGALCLGRLEGMFAFALYDTKSRSVFLARDRFGIKPLYYAQTQRDVYFSSELHPLTQISGIDTRYEPAALDAFFSHHFIPAPSTVYRGIRALPAAHWLKISRAGLETQHYWSLDPSVHCEDSLADAEDKVLGLLEGSVRKHLMSDVPIGAFLSGGVDSSLIVALMRRCEPKAQINTISVGFDESTYDERGHARFAAKRSDTKHIETTLRTNVAVALPDLVRHYGQPFGDSSAVPCWYLSKETCRHVKVALSGDGADEAFMGYGRYDSAAAIAAFRKLPRGIRTAIESLLLRSIPDFGIADAWIGRLKDLLAAGEGDRPLYQHSKPSAFNAAAKVQLYSDVFRQSLPDGSSEALLKTPDVHGMNEVLSTYFSDFAHYLPDDILTKVDIASMAHGLEVRPPFLDHHLVEYAAGLPARYKYRLFDRKRILKRIGCRFYPRRFMYRKKHGFELPIGAWLRTTLKEPFQRCVEESPAISPDGIMRRSAVDILMQEHLSGARNHSARLWDIWMLAEWSKNYLKIG